MAPRADTEPPAGALTSVAVTQLSENAAAPASGKSPWKWAPSFLLATALLVLVAFAAVGHQGPAQRSGYSLRTHGTGVAPRRVLTIQNDSCYGWPGTFAVERFDDIGSRNICVGLCSMNGDVCIAHEYRPSTEVCFLKVKCAIQLDSSVMVPIED